MKVSGMLKQTINGVHVNHYLFLLLILTNIMDFVSTYIGITSFGSTEMNPVMASAIAFTGTVWAIFWVKALVFGHMYFHYYHTTKGPAMWLLPRTTWILVILNVVFLGVVINNTIVIMGKL